jgi:hypothetical protein
VAEEVGDRAGEQVVGDDPEAPGEGLRLADREGLPHVATRATSIPATSSITTLPGSWTATRASSRPPAQTPTTAARRAAAASAGSPGARPHTARATTALVTVPGSPGR